MTDNVTPLREPGVLPRQPPINVEAEQHLLGAFLCDNRLLEVIADFLRPEHFANATHARIFDAIQKYVDRGQTANVVTLKATFDQETALAPIGGAKYLARLAGGGRAPGACRGPALCAPRLRLLAASAINQFRRGFDLDRADATVPRKRESEDKGRRISSETGAAPRLLETQRFLRLSG
jgi:hypothetical protein